MLKLSLNFNWQMESMTTVSQTSQVLPISMLRRHELARIVELHGEDCCVQRLEEIGFRAGITICMLNPGAPAILAMEGRRISLRIDCHTEILVEPLGLARNVSPTNGALINVDC